MPPVSSEEEHQHTSAYPAWLNFLAYAILSLAVYLVWHTAYWPAIALLWLPMAYFGHTVLLAFHEAVHYTLSPSKRLNEFRGFMIGVTVLIPLSVYRQLHGYHHAALASERDMELWPYVNPKASWAWRFFSAWTELLLGFFFTPLVFLHGILKAKDVEPEVMRRVYLEYALGIALWTVALLTVNYLGMWPEFLVVYLIPAILAGNLQTARKFVEHMGLYGDGPLTATRSVHHEDKVGTLMCRTMLNIPHHGTHHRFGKLPYFKLVEATPKAYAPPAEGPVYRSYTRAFFAMLPSLLNPKIGKQWLKGQ